MANWNSAASKFLKITSTNKNEDNDYIESILLELQKYGKRNFLTEDNFMVSEVLHKCTSNLFSEAYSSSLLKTINITLNNHSIQKLHHSKKSNLIIWLSELLNRYLKELNVETIAKNNSDLYSYNQLIDFALQSICTILKTYHKYDDEVIISLAGSKGSITHTLEHCGTTWLNDMHAVQCLHLLTYVPPEVIATNRQTQSKVLPDEVVASVQKVVIQFLQVPVFSNSEFPQRPYLKTAASCIDILYNLVVCAPANTLGNVIVSTCRPFVYYGLPGYSHEDLILENLDNLVDIEVSSGVESDASAKNYTNRNRRKRLRRKRPRPSKGSSVVIKPIADPVSAPIVVPQPPDASLLDTISLKPQWATKSATGDNSTNKIVTNKEVKSDPVAGSFKDQCSEARKTDKKFQEYSSGSDHQKDDDSPYDWGSNSDVDLSDVDIKYEKMSTLLSDVRQKALQTVNSVIEKIGKQHKFSFWPPLMCQDPSLMTCILRDPSSSVRMAALQVLNTFLMDSSRILAMAVDVDEKGSYATISYQLGSSIRELHRCLVLSLLSEKYAGGLVRTLKTIELLVENVNYSKLRPGLLTKIVTHVKYFMKYSEAVVRANAFSVMVSILMLKPQTAELQELLLKYRTSIEQPLLCLDSEDTTSLEEVLPEDEESCNEDDVLESKLENLNITTNENDPNTKNNKTIVSWLIRRCIDSLLSPDKVSIHIQVQLQSLKVLSALVSEHLKLIVPNLNLIQHVIMICCDQQALTNRNIIDNTPVGSLGNNVLDSTTNLQGSNNVGGLTIVVEYSYILLGSMMGAIKNEVNKDLNEEGGGLSHSMAVKIWIWALQEPLKPLITYSEEDKQSSSSRTITSAADVLAQLHPKILDSMSEDMIDRIIFCITSLIKSQDTEFQLSGIKIVAVLVGYSAIQSHKNGPSLVLVTILTTIKILSSKESNVNRDRLLASWALANVSAVLHLFVEKSNPKLNLDTNLITQMLDIGIKACSEIDKIKPHGVRSIGNILAILEEEQVKQLESVINSAIQTLIQCACKGNNMKMRWNACHALGTILNCQHLSCSSSSWKKTVFVTLCSLVENFKNYKVRIQACSALCGLSTRESYGNEYILVWKALLRGLDNSQNIYDYHEIKHRDELINQISQGICQMIYFLHLKDTGDLLDILQLHQDTVKTYMHKSYQILPPEKASYFLQAQDHVSNLLSTDALMERQEDCLLILKSITDFKLDIT